MACTTLEQIFCLFELLLPLKHRIQKEKVEIMAVADELEAVIDTLPETYQEAARELVAEIQARPEDDQLRALKELISDKVRALEPEDEEGDDE